jgi:hypothetical protein
MLKSRGISYLVVLSVSLGLSAIVAIDVLRPAPSRAPLTAHLKPSHSPSGADLQAKIIVAAAAGGSATQPSLNFSAWYGASFGKGGAAVAFSHGRAT